MTSTVPNKEIVRRVCHLAGATECYLSVKTNDETIGVLTNITDDAITNCLMELESWTGIKFRLHNYSSDKNYRRVCIKSLRNSSCKYLAKKS